MEELSSGKINFFNVVDKFIETEKISHAYLIEIDDYDCDFQCILDFIKMLFCKCKFNDLKENYLCKAIDNNTYPDLKIIEPTGQWIKKSQLLELQSEYSNKSLLNNLRIYVIKEAEKLNGSSANTILKFLEEPEDGIIAILVTKNRYQVMNTILSRCQILSIHNGKTNDFSNEAVKILQYISKKDELFINYNEIIEFLLPDKQCAKDLLNQVEHILMLYVNSLADKQKCCSLEISNILKDININSIINYIIIIENELQKLVYNVNYKLWLDCLFAQLIGG